MSRTDKTQPLWTLAEYWAPVHRYRCAHSSWLPGTKICSLPKDPPYEHPRYAATRTARCYRRPAVNLYLREDRARLRRRYYSRYADFMKDYTFRARSRRAAKAECSLARQQYHATGEVDVIPNTWQARDTNGGWWD